MYVPSGQWCKKEGGGVRVCLESHKIRGVPQILGYASPATSPAPLSSRRPVHRSPESIEGA